MQRTDLARHRLFFKPWAQHYYFGCFMGLCLGLTIGAVWHV